MKNQIVTKLKNSNCAKLEKLDCDNSKTQIVIVIKLTVVTEVVIMTSFSKKHLNTLTTDQLSGPLFATLAMFLTLLVDSKAITMHGHATPFLATDTSIRLQTSDLFEDNFLKLY